jgi:hypothetical protein
MICTMAKKDLKTRVYAAADELFIERGSFDRFGYREVRERAKGASNDVMVLFEEWKESRAALMKSRPEALVAAAEEFAGRLWLMVRLLANGGDHPHSDAADGRPIGGGPALEVGTPGMLPERREAPRSGQGRRKAKVFRGAGPALFSDLPRPDRPVPKRKAKDGKTRKSVLRRMGGIKLVPPRPAQPTVEVSDADWKGARDEPLAKAVAGELRKEGSRLRARDIFKRLPPSRRPGTVEHAHRDLQKGLTGSKVRWFKGGWFWFHGEEIPKERPWRVSSKGAKQRAGGEDLWWQVAHTISQLDRAFTLDEINTACGERLSKLGKSWLRLRLTRARERNPPFVKWTPPDVYQWTGLPPSEVVKGD